jgi:hypothetical protein
MTAADWTGIYPEHLDGYQLFRTLDRNKKTTVAVKDKDFTLEFVGDGVGSDCWLEVRNEDGRVRKYGWGQRVEHVFQALEEMKLGWDKARVYRFKRVARQNDREVRLL